MTSKDYAAAPQSEVYWRYEEPVNKGVKMFLLTRGGTAVTGSWYGKYGEFFLGWSPMLKVDKAALQVAMDRHGVVYIPPPAPDTNMTGNPVLLPGD